MDGKRGKGGHPGSGRHREGMWLAGGWLAGRRLLLRDAWASDVAFAGDGQWPASPLFRPSPAALWPCAAWSVVPARMVESFRIWIVSQIGHPLRSRLSPLSIPAPLCCGSCGGYCAV